MPVISNGVKGKIIVILGPTSSGKTKLAVKLAKKYNGEIVSADSRQVYRGMDVGTGKDLAEYIIKSQIPSTKSQINSKFKIQNSKLRMIPYHLIDVISPKKQFTVADYQKMAYKAIEDILSRGKLPIICGGTGLYISAVVEGFQFPMLKATSYKLQATRNRLDKLTLKQLLQKLKQVDPKTYKIIDRNNRRRVQRGLEIYYQTGQPKSAWLKKQPPPYDFLLLGLSFPQEILRQRINQRLKHRLEKEGLISEVKRLHQQKVSWKRLEDFGLEYRWVSRYLQGKIDSEGMYQKLLKAIVDFAKRQMTWFSRQLSGKRGKGIKWIRNQKEAEGLIAKFIK